MLHVAQIGLFLDQSGRRPRELLRDWPSLVDIAEAAGGSVDRVSVVQSCTYSESFALNGIEYRFVAAHGAPGADCRTRALAPTLRELQPDVLHVHGLGFPEEVGALAGIAPQTPILAQDHADRPPRFWRRRTWRRGMTHLAGVAVCAAEQIQPYRAAGLLGPNVRVFEIPESTSRFVPGDREDARAATRLSGDPAVLWVGRLDSNKDPFTVLDAVRRAVSSLPGLELWCCFGTAPLRAEVERRVAADPVLSVRVHLLGTVPHAQIELLMRAADLYVSASRREGSGYALIEAMACGLPPVVTEIPSFTALTGRARVGDFWRCGDAAGLARALEAAAARPRTAARAQVRAYFEAELGLAALGRRLGAAYRQLAEGRPMAATAAAVG